MATGEAWGVASGMETMGLVVVVTESGEEAAVGEVITATGEGCVVLVVMRMSLAAVVDVVTVEG